MQPHQRGGVLARFALGFAPHTPLVSLRSTHVLLDFIDWLHYGRGYVFDY